MLPEQNFLSCLFFAMQPEIPFLPVFSSMKQLIRYSLGSVALGSLVLLFVESVRFMLDSIRRKLKVANTTPEGCMGKTTYHTSRSCFHCIEWIIRSVNHYAYIMIAITGKSFCRASAIATELIISNILKIGRKEATFQDSRFIIINNQFLWVI
ncbi:CHOLINE TRANSPORTER-LIKE (SLC FAMILY 44) [Salix purpurea]|uniref:Choline transporter-like protein n=1 Tax=Salix purpurea TaxID=77065 RepID=A0A9Q0W3Y3_SALPP|nr:CHOLINE TRANSPORTER-LIKE (SLC FAMILY 44) [Salix purpurea]